MRRFIAFTDACSIIGGGLLGYQLRYGSLPDAFFVAQLLFAGAITVAWLAAIGMYGGGGTRPAGHVGLGILAITAGLVSTLVVSFSTTVYIPRTWFVLTWILGVALFVLTRAAWQVVIARA